VAIGTANDRVANTLPQGTGRPPHEPLALKILEWGVFVPVATGLAIAVARSRFSYRLDLAEAATWIALVAVTDLFPVPLWRNVSMSLSLPILLAASLLFPPELVGLLALVASTDPRELTRDVSIGHAVANRTQVAISATLAAIAFSAVGGEVGEWPRFLFAGLVAIAVDVAANMLFVVLASRLYVKEPARIIFRNLTFQQPVFFFASLISFGMMGVLLAQAYASGGPWALASFVIPGFLARQAFIKAAEARTLSDAVEGKTRALALVTKRTADERKDERLSVAAGLHDEVLPPLFKVHLIGQVIKEDLASGRLLALEEDVPDLLDSVTKATSAARHLIRRLRYSSIGSGGLAQTLQLLVRQLEQDTIARISIDVIEDTRGTPLIELLTYQVAREALRNAVRHANCRQIWLSVAREDDFIRLTIADDGRGFEVGSVDVQHHFGVQLMRERVELAGGDLQIESHPDRGTRVVARLPAHGDIP
jgi:signal transduction histidine kinase